MIRVFTKKPGEKPNLADEEGIILRNGASVEHCCHAVHRSIKEQFKYALVWGTSAKYSPQRVGLTHCLHHDDVLQIIKK
jgi:ribosome-interacting GTPase 1